MQAYLQSKQLTVSVDTGSERRSFDLPFNPKIAEARLASLSSIFCLFVIFFVRPALRRRSTEKVRGAANGGDTGFGGGMNAE